MADRAARLPLAWAEGRSAPAAAFPSQGFEPLGLGLARFS